MQMRFIRLQTVAKILEAPSQQQFVQRFSLLDNHKRNRVALAVEHEIRRIAREVRKEGT